MVDFIQCGDIHIGETRSLEGYLDRHWGVLKQIADDASRLGVPLVITGDLFHTKKITQEERHLADKWIGYLEKNNVQGLIIAGNHDHLYGDVTSLDGYAHLGLGIHIVTWSPQIVTMNGIDYICIPWRGYSTEELEMEIRKLLTLCTSDKIVVVAHECILNSKFDSGILATKGSKLPSLPEVSYYAMGDIHTHQAANVSNGWYSGAPLQFKYDDKESKGYLRVTLGEDPEFIRTSFKPFRVVKSINDVKDDAYYFVQGSINDVMGANKNENVFRTEWVQEDSDVIEYSRTDITTGLPEFLAEKGCDEDLQQQGLEWVERILEAA